VAGKTIPTQNWLNLSRKADFVRIGTDMCDGDGDDGECNGLRKQGAHKDFLKTHLTVNDFSARHRMILNITPLTCHFSNPDSDLHPPLQTTIHGTAF
jgi:hypothetical protein